MASDPIPGPKISGFEWKRYALVAAGVLLAILILQNLQEVQVRFLFINTQIPLIFALLIVGALGALVGWAAPRVRRGGPGREPGARTAEVAIDPSRAGQVLPRFSGRIEGAIRTSTTGESRPRWCRAGRPPQRRGGRSAGRAPGPPRSGGA